MKNYKITMTTSTKNGRDLIEKEARKFHNDLKIEFDRKIKIMNRDQKARELYYGGACEGVGWEYHLCIQRHHAFTQKLCNELSYYVKIENI